MPDRKKVIKEFESFIKEFHPACTSEGVELDMFREVLGLLKEQPEQKPGHWENGHCSVCGEDIAGRLDKWTSIQWFIFCPRCGNRMDSEQG